MRGYGYKTASGLPQWLNRDPLGEIGFELKSHRRNFGLRRYAELMPEGANIYAFVGNKPIGYIDENGESATAVVGGFIGGDAAIPDPSDLAWPKWAGYAIALAAALAIDSCSPSEKCDLTGEMEQPATGDPHELDGIYKPAMKVCVYTCKKKGVVRKYFPPGTPCEKSMEQP